MATLNSKIVLEYLKQHFGQELSKQQIAEGANVSVSAVGLIMKSHIDNARATVRIEEHEEVDDKGKTKTKKYYYYTLTEEGLAFDIEAYEAEKKIRDAEKRKAAREAKKAAAAE